MQSENTADLSAALAKAQSGMTAAHFNKVNPHFKSKYADLASVIDALRSPFSSNGLSYTQTTEIRDGGFVLVTTLRHSTGQWIASEYPLPMGAKPQELGSALTYARRYSLSAIAGVAADDDDDDAERAIDRNASTPKAKSSPIKPAIVEPPVNPETGEVSPHLIQANDAMTWGGLMIAAVNIAKDEDEVQQWVDDCKPKLDKLKSAAPKIHEFVMSAIADKRNSFRKDAA